MEIGEPCIGDIVRHKIFHAVGKVYAKYIISEKGEERKVIDINIAGIMKCEENINNWDILKRGGN